MSDKPVAERLQVKHARTIAVVAAPEGLDVVIGVPGARAALADADVVLLFVRNRAEFETALPALIEQVAPLAIVWLAYPKLTSAHAGDLNRDILHGAALARGLQTVSQIAIDKDWSALRLKRSC